MSKWEENYQRFKSMWSVKPISKIKKELDSYQKRFSKHQDTFFHQGPPEELSDGDRVIALKELINEMKDANQ